MTRHVWSSSRIARAACPSSLARYARGERGDGDHEHMRVGTAFHAAAEAYTRHLIESGVGTDWDEAPRFVADVIRTAGLSPEQEIDLRGVWRRFTADWMIRPDCALGVERMLVVDRDLRPLDGLSGFDLAGNPIPDVVAMKGSRPPFIRGRVDYAETIEGTTTVVDWKTAWGATGAADVRASVQARLYAWLAVRCLNPAADEINVVFRFVRFGASRTATYTAAEIHDFGDDLLATIARLESRKTETPRRCGFCDICDFRGDCEAWAGDRGPDIPADGPGLIEAAIYHGTVASAARSRLRALVKAHGPIRAGDQEFGPKSRATCAYDTVAALEFLELHVEDPREAFKFDPRAKCLKELTPDAWEDLKAVAGTPGVDVRVDLRKVPVIPARDAGEDDEAEGE